VNITK